MGVDDPGTVSNDEYRLTKQEVLTILNEECDGKPHNLLKNHKVRYNLARWKANPINHDFAYTDVLEEINWRGVEMGKDEFEETLEDVWDQLSDDETSDQEVETQDIPDLSPDEFYQAFDWDRMQDREMARKCHLWCKANANIIFSNEQVFVRDGDIWVRNEGYVARTLQDLLRKHYGENVKKEFLNGYVKVNSEYHVDWDDMGIRGPRCAVENGILNLLDGEIEEEIEPDDYALMQFPVRWEGLDAERETFQETFTNRSVDQSDRAKLQEFAGTILHTNEYPHKKAVMMVGGGDNGKGVFEKIMVNVIGSDNAMHDDLADLTENTFGAQRLRYSAANINSDIQGNTITETATLKKLTGRDWIRVEEKYETAYEIKNPAKLMFAANSIPKVKDADLAFYGRWLFVHFPNKFTKADDQYMDADPDLLDNIVDNELSGVLAWMVEGYQRWYNNGRTFTNQENRDEVRRRWFDYADPTDTFIRNYVEWGNPRKDSGGSIDSLFRVDEMYDYYERYMATKPSSAETKRTLHSYISNRFETDTKASRKAVYPNEDKEAVKVWEDVYIPEPGRDEIDEMYENSL
jgi:P4 family phage/plasmid primase-like protien